MCVTGVHGIMEAQSDDRFRDILNRSFLTTPDGMPTVWLGRVHGFKHMNRVYGPDYMLGSASDLWPAAIATFFMAASLV